ncbi:epithelial membrane protein 1 [Biomphalaria glabrata]
MGLARKKCEKHTGLARKRCEKHTGLARKKCEKHKGSLGNCNIFQSCGKNINLKGLIFLDITAMGLPSGFTVLHCVGTILLSIGVLLHIVGLATPSWSSGSFSASSQTTYVSGTIMYGLWRFCIGTDACLELPSQRLTDEWRAAGAFAILGMLAGLGALGLVCMHFVMRVLSKPDMNILKLIIPAAGIVALLCVVISTSCYGGGVHPKINMNTAGFTSVGIGYSLILSAIGGILICVGGVLFYVAGTRSPQ